MRAAAMAASQLRAPIRILFCVTLLLLCTAKASYPDLEESEIEALGLLDDDLSSLEDADEFSHSEEHEEEEEHLEGAAEYEEGEGEEEEEGEEGEGEGDEGGLSGISTSEPGVIVLVESNFSSFLDTNRFAMVEFYAPWCGHCQALAPEYAAAATELSTSTVPVPLAKMDATEFPDLAQQYGIEGFPTILFFIDGKPKPYSHHRTREDIVTWVKKKVGPVVSKVTSASDAETILETGNTVVVGFFHKLEGHEVEEYAAAARQEDSVLFYQTVDEDVAEAFSIKKGTKAPALALVKNASEKVVFYDGDFRRDALSDFIVANKLPLVCPFTSDTASDIFESSIKKQVLLFAPPEDFAKILPTFEGAAKSFKGKIIFVHVDSSNEEIANPIIQFFGINLDKPTIVGFTVSEDQPRTFLFEDEITVDTIKEFAMGFLDNKLKQFYKSDPVPETNDGYVTIVVGKTFNEIVLDESQDVLLKIYAPWCEHSQALAPLYEKLAKALQKVESLVVAKMDGTTNEHARAQVEGYPTVLFFPAGNKSADPILVDSEMSVKGLYQFLKHNAGIPFTLAKEQKITAEEQATHEMMIETVQATEQVQDMSYAVKDEL